MTAEQTNGVEGHEAAAYAAKYSKTFKAVLNTSYVEKILKVAKRPTKEPSTFPHLTDPTATNYVYAPFDWWTAGFFPGSVRALYERVHKGVELPIVTAELDVLANSWQQKLSEHQHTTRTHDVGFLIMPSFYRDYQINGNKKSAEVIVTTANSLLTRWSDKVQSLRSWDQWRSTRGQITSTEHDFLVIIDNMMNLDLLYAATEITGDPKYADKATRHAETTLKYHVRKDDTTYHLVVFDPESGERKIGLTAQGYDHESTWSRGQAWALYGFASVYKYTKDPKFLDAAKRLSAAFLSRVEDGVVHWDFDAPRPTEWDSSAGMIACSGLLLLCQLQNNYEYVPQVASIVQKCLDGALAPADGDVILHHATVHNNRWALKKDAAADTGLVYADYYFLEVGNRLIDLGLV